MKRLIDVFFAVGGLILFSPILIWLVWRIHKDIGSPVFFTQKRPGKNGKPFTLIKFRSMHTQRPPHEPQLSDADRLTPFGRKLRSSSADELPELWNVLKGEMSLVGPRPLLMEYLPLFSDEQSRRHDVLPGITGWAQVNGRNLLSWEERLSLDVWYVENKTIWLDFKILWMTAKAVLIREGITAAGEATMSKFVGKK